MDDEVEVDIAGTIIIDFALHAKVKAEGLSHVFRFFLHMIDGVWDLINWDKINTTFNKEKNLKKDIQTDSD